MSTAGLKRWLPGLRATVIGIPYLWLLLFFAVPFLIVLMISFSLSRVGSPPYTWLLQYADGGFSLKLNLENYLALFRDSIYAQAFLSSIRIAAISTFLTLLIGYPMAYAIARLSPAARNVAMMLVVLPSWTSFLIRVYAWKAILDRNGLLDQYLYPYYQRDIDSGQMTRDEAREREVASDAAGALADDAAVGAEFDDAAIHHRVPVELQRRDTIPVRRKPRDAPLESGRQQRLPRPQARRQVDVPCPVQAHGVDLSDL